MASAPHSCIISIIMSVEPQMWFTEGIDMVSKTLVRFGWMRVFHMRGDRRSVPDPISLTVIKSTPRLS